MLRTRAINYLIKNRGYKNYLEIGLSWPDFNYTKVFCENKESCDPYFPSDRDSLVTRDNLPKLIQDNLTYLMTSDEMFESMPEDKKYDIVLIDGLHTEEQCSRDIVNSMKHLNPGGVILVHDVIPKDEEMQEENSKEVVWVGSVWKSIVKLNNTNISFHTISEDYGLAIINYCPNPDFGNYLEPSGYDFKEDFSNEAVHLISNKEFCEMYPPINVLNDGQPVNVIMYVDVDKNELSLTLLQKLHFECLEYYKDSFTNVTIILGVDKDCPFNLVKQFKNKIYSIGFNCNLIVKTVKKTIFGGSSVFYNEIINNLENIDGITAFIDCSKKDDSTDKKKISLYRSIVSAYFQMFDNMDEVKLDLNEKQKGLCYGAFLFHGNSVETKNKWYYYGGFQWINAKRLLEYIKKNNVLIPKIENKTSYETFLGDLLPFDYSIEDSYSNMYISSEPSVMDENSESATFVIFDEGKNNDLFNCLLEDIFELLCIPLED